MAITLRCPTGHALKVPTTLAGKRVRCPKCSESVRVPEPPKPARPREIAVASEPAVSEPERAAPPPPPPGSAGTRWRTADSSFAIPSKHAGEEEIERRPPPLPPPRVADEKSGAVVPEKRPAPLPEETRSRPTAPLNPPPRPAAPEVKIAPPPRPETSPEQSPARPERKKSRRGRHKAMREKLAGPAAPIAPDGKADENADSDKAEGQPERSEPILAPPMPKEKPRGVRPSRRNLRVIHQLAGGLALVGVASMAPGLIGWIIYMQGMGVLAPWIWPLMVLGVLQLAYALYLVQLPDWTSIWVVTWVGVLCASIYAMGVGLAVFAGRGSDFALMLGLGDPNAARKLLLWCLMLLSLTTLVAYFCGRVSHRWWREEHLAATKPHLLSGEKETIV